MNNHIKRIIVVCMLMTIESIQGITFVAPVRGVSHQIRLRADAHQSSYPFISADTFRSICDFFFDETKIPLDPALVKDGDIIYLNADYTDFFFARVHPLINAQYILISHASDFPVPGKNVRYLDDEKLVVWFAQNVDRAHPKLFPIPIGIDNRWLDVWGNVDRMRHCMQNASKKKDTLLYMNFNLCTNRAERTPVFEFFKNKRFCRLAGHSAERPLSFQDYLYDVARSKFVLSPNGNGVDCHRTWHALLMGSIPIVKRSAITVMFEDLPVLIIDDWSIITEEYLNKKYEEMQSRHYNEDKLWMDYWLGPIKEIQARIRNN